MHQNIKLSSPFGAVFAPGVVVPVHGAELGLSGRQRVSDPGVVILVGDLEERGLVADREIINNHGRLVAVKIFDLDQQLHLKNNS